MGRFYDPFVDYPRIAWQTDCIDTMYAVDGGIVLAGCVVMIRWWNKNLILQVC